MSNCQTVPSIELLDSMVSGLPSRMRENWLLCMLTCYADDSGSEPKGVGPVFVLAGYVSTVDRWKLFSDAWDIALKSGPRPLDYFKMSEAQSLKFQFLHWTEPERDSKLLELAQIVKCNVMFSTQAILWWKDFDVVRKRYPDYPVHEYDLLFHHVMTAAVLYMMGEKSEEKVEFIFDDQGIDGDRARASYRLAEKQFPPEMLAMVAGPPNHKSDKIFLPLQAADLIAWQLRRFCFENEQHGQDVGKYTFHPTMEVLDTIPHRTHNLYQAKLVKFFEHLKKTFPSPNLL